MDYKKYRLEDLRKHIGAVFQQYHTYAFSVYENIAMDIVDDAQKPIIDELLKEIGLYDVLKDMSRDLSAPLSNEFEKGLVLSGGQQQKIALARAIYRQTPIVVLDEPSSALDPLAETEMLNIMNENFKNKTVFMVSHRLSATKNCDQIIHLSKGRIIEKGTHAQLMDRNSDYAKMYTVQAEKYQLS